MSGAFACIRMKVMPERSAGLLTDTSHRGSVLKFDGFCWWSPARGHRSLQFGTL